jgi:hypothetical protein
MADRKPARIKQVYDPGAARQAVYSDEAQSERSSEAGLNWKPKGAIGTRVRVEKAMPVMLYNSAAAVAFVKFGDQSVTAAADAASGIPVLPNSILVVNSGLDEYVIASAATVFAYIPELYETE